MVRFWFQEVTPWKRCQELWVILWIVSRQHVIWVTRNLTLKSRAVAGPQDSRKSGFQIKGWVHYKLVYHLERIDGSNLMCRFIIAPYKKATELGSGDRHLLSLRCNPPNASNASTVQLWSTKISTASAHRKGWTPKLYESPVVWKLRSKCSTVMC